MTDKLPAGPYRTVEIDDGVQAPFYIIPFDEQGHCQAPLTQEQLLTSLQSGNYTDIFLFSHGWNTDWSSATRTYDSFISGYIQMRKSNNLSYTRPFQPLFIGIFWPSIALVLPWEEGPSFAGTPAVDAQIAQERLEVQSLAALVPQENVERFYALAQRGQDLQQSEAVELARMLAPLYLVDGDEIPAKGDAPSVEDIVKVWQTATIQAQAADDDDDDTTPTPTIAGPRAAGALGFLDPRMIIRLATVLQMKDRAGVVGAHGVGDLLRDLLAKSGSAYLHLIGHSYGCKVMLSALCYQPIPRNVHSLFLLQPAISYLCFANDATGNDQPGGYRDALNRVDEPIMTTFSSEDQPLTQFFHLAVRRPSDIGEMQIAGAPPSRYAALGGYGPGGCDADCTVITMKATSDTYNLGANTTKIYALNGSNDIHGHGDISNPHTWWALYEQVIS